MSFIARPTRVLIDYLTQEVGSEPRMEFNLGRLAMALEIITVVKTIEDEVVPMLALQREEIVSVLTTLLRDQDLAEVAEEWYERLNQWRNVSFVPEPSLARSDDVGFLSLPSRAVPSSRLEALREATALLGDTDAPTHSDQSPALPSGESGEVPISGDEPTPSE